MQRRQPSSYGELEQTESGLNSQPNLHSATLLAKRVDNFCAELLRQLPSPQRPAGDLGPNEHGDVVLVVRCPYCHAGPAFEALGNIAVEPARDEDFDRSRCAARQVFEQVHKPHARGFFALVQRVDHERRLRERVDELAQQLLCHFVVHFVGSHAARLLASVQPDERAVHAATVGGKRELARNAAECGRGRAAAWIVTVEVEVGECLVIVLSRQIVEDVVDYTGDDLRLASSSCEAS